MAQKTDRPTDRVLEEHAALRTTLARIESMVTGYPPAGDEKPWLESILSELKRLQPVLAEHFEHEEQSGLFDSIEESWPAASRECKALVTEHESILEAVVKIRTDAVRMLEEGATPRGLGERILELIESLAEHESRENDLLYMSLDGGPQAQD